MNLSHTIWSERVAGMSDLPDQRLQNRLTHILVDTLESPSASIPQAAGGDAGRTKATYRFYSNPRVTCAGLNRGFSLETAHRCLNEVVILVVQDSTTLNFSGSHSIAEMGPIDSGNLGRGLHLHTTLAATQSGQVLGILDQQCWARPQAEQVESQKVPRKPKQSDEKESAKWINGLEGARSALYEAAGERPVPRLIHIMDREGDAYEVLMAIEESGDSAIIRCAQNRRVQGSLAKAHEAVRSQPVLCEAAVEVDRKGGIPQRQAWVEVRSTPVTLEPNRSKYPHAWPMVWNLVEVWEPVAPLGVEALHWLLWTREPAATAVEALEVARKYTCRWPIEEMHLVLKSGCKVEILRLETWERQEKAVRVNAAVAARIVLLRDLARENPEAPALEVLEKDEAEALVNHFGKGKPLPIEKLTIGQAVLWIGRLGGHLNRKRDGMPGVRTMWRGLQALSLLVAGFRAGRRLLE